MTTRSCCRGARGCRCALHVEQSSGRCSFDASACVLHARRAEAEAEALGEGLAVVALFRCLTYN